MRLSRHAVRHDPQLARADGRGGSDRVAATHPFLLSQRQKEGTAMMQDEEHTGRQHIEQRYAALREAGLKIDPSTADVTWHYGDTFDPYGIKDLPEEYRQSGRVYFARAPDSDVWVCFEDLPEETVEALWRRASDWGVLTPNNLPFFLEQNMMVTLRDHPELLFQYERLVESLDRTVEGLPDEGFKARWRRGGPRLKKLIDVAKREAGGGRSSTAEPTAKV